jgi:hypothetical protein
MEDFSMAVIPKHEPKRKTKTAKPEAQQPAQKSDLSNLEGAARYGRYYWCIKSGLSENGEIYVYADEVRYLPSGGVLFVGHDVDHESTNLALAVGQWSAVFAASVWDGHAIAVEHWKGEIAR